MFVDPYDEKSIGDRDTIIRRIDPNQHVIWDENRQRYRIASKAFSKSSGEKGGMSVDIEALIVAAGLNPQAFVTTPVFMGSVAFSAADIWALDLMIGYDPIENVPNVLDNPYHGEVWPSKPANRFTSKQKQGLKKTARWYVALKDVDIV